MAVDPIAFCTTELPKWFERAEAALGAAADGGEKRAQARLGDYRAASGTARIVFEGQDGNDVFLVVDRCQVRVLRERPQAPPLRSAFSVPLSAARRALELIAGGPLVVEVSAAAAVAGLPSARAEQLFGMYKFGFDVAVTGLPELGDVTVRVGLGRDLPATPEFTLRVSYADLAAARERRMGPHELFASGKLQIAGDVAKAMMLGMTLAQLR